MRARSRVTKTELTPFETLADHFASDDSFLLLGRIVFVSFSNGWTSFTVCLFKKSEFYFKQPETSIQRVNYLYQY